MKSSKISKRTQNKYLKELTSLTVLGLPSEILVPESFKILKKLFTNRDFTFLWTNSNGMIQNMYTDHHGAIMMFKNIMQVAGTKTEFDAGPTTSELIQKKIYCHNSKYNYSSFSKSALYNEYIAPANVHKPTRFTLSPERLDRNGMLIFSTEKNEDFMSDLETTFFVNEVRPIYTNILNFDANLGAQFNFHLTQRSLGTLVVTKNGEIEFSDQTATHILNEIQNTGFVNNSIYLNSDELKKVFIDLVKKLIICQQGESITAPEFVFKNQFGTYRFTSQALWHNNKIDEHYFQIKILHEVLAEFAWINKLSTLNLSPMERIVALEILKGRTVQDASQTLGMSRNTGISHFKSILRKLKIHSREQLCALFR